MARKMLRTVGETETPSPMTKQRHSRPLHRGRAPTSMLNIRASPASGTLKVCRTLWFGCFWRGLRTYVRLFLREFVACRTATRFQDDSSKNICSVGCEAPAADRIELCRGHIAVRQVANRCLRLEGAEDMSLQIWLVIRCITRIGAIPHPSWRVSPDRS